MTTTSAPLTSALQTRDTLSDQIIDLGEVLSWLEEHAEQLAGFYVHPSAVGHGVNIQARDAEQMAEAVRIVIAGAPFGTVEKDVGDLTASCTRRFGSASVKVYASRENVCEKVVVGVETVEVPDPDAPLVTVEREVTRWECAPLLAGGAA